MLIAITGKETFHPAKWQQQFKVGLGLDLSSGTQVVLKAHTANGVPTQGAMNQAISVLLSRVNGTGNSGAQVQQQGPDLINVSIPGQPPENVLKLVSTTAKMAFRPVYLVEPYTGAAAPNPVARPSSTATPSTSASPKASTNAQSERLASPTATSTAKASTSATPSASASASPSSTATTPTTYGNASLVNAATLKLFNKLVCKPGRNSTTVNPSWKTTVGYSLNADQYDDPSSQIVSCDSSGTKYALGPAVFEGPDMTSVNTGLLQNTTQWVVDLTLNGKAAATFGTLTTNQYNCYYAAPTAATRTTRPSTRPRSCSTATCRPPGRPARRSPRATCRSPAAAPRVHPGAGEPAGRHPQVRLAAAQLHAADRRTRSPRSSATARWTRG